MDKNLLEQAKAQKAQGRTYREIATELGVSLATLWRALGKESGEATAEEAAGMKQEQGGRSQQAQEEDDQKRSEVFTARIEETKARLRAIEKELSGLPKQKEQLLAAEEVDHAGLNKLDEQEAQLSKEKGHLTQRLPILAKQQEAAGAKEAQARLDEMPAEVERLRAETESLLAEYQAAEAVLIEKLEKLGEPHKQRHDLGQESAYLTTRYRGLTRHSLAQLPELPDLSEIQKAQGRVAGQWSLRDSIWIQKRQDWENERRASHLATVEAAGTA